MGDLNRFFPLYSFFCRSPLCDNLILSTGEVKVVLFSLILSFEKMIMFLCQCLFDRQVKLLIWESAPA